MTKWILQLVCQQWGFALALIGKFSNRKELPQWIDLQKNLKVRVLKLLVICLSFPLLMLVALSVRPRRLRIVLLFRNTSWIYNSFSAYWKYCKYWKDILYIYRNLLIFSTTYSFKRISRIYVAWSKYSKNTQEKAPKCI